RVAFRRRGEARREGRGAHAREPRHLGHPCAPRTRSRQSRMNETLTIRAIRTTAVEVPMKHVLGTSQAAVRAAPLLLIDLETEEGITGRSYLFCYLRGGAVSMAGLFARVG